MKRETINIQCLVGLDGISMDEGSVICRAAAKWISVTRIKQALGLTYGHPELTQPAPRTFFDQPKIVGCLCQISEHSVVNPPERLYLLFHDTHFILSRSDSLCLGRLASVYNIENFRVKVRNSFMQITETLLENAVDVMATDYSLNQQKDQGAMHMFQGYSVAVKDQTWNVRIVFYSQSDKKEWLEDFLAKVQMSRNRMRQSLIQAL